MTKSAVEGARAWLNVAHGYERFLMTAGAGLVNTGLLIAGLIDQDTYAMLTAGTVAAFITGSTVSHVKVISSGQNGAVAPQGDPK